MTAVPALLGYALLLGTVGAGTLSRAEWVRRAPRLGIAVWQALSASVFLAVVLGGAAVTIPTLHLGDGIAGLSTRTWRPSGRSTTVPVGPLWASLAARLRWQP